MSECPFKVGDRIHELSSMWVAATDISAKPLQPFWQYDMSKPDATVTEITDQGFCYEYDYPVVIVARWEWVSTGGECFPEGYSYWSKIDKV